MSRGPPFSAGELEKFSYCPLSWWLGGEEAVATGNQRTGEGSRRHMSLSRDLSELSSSQRSVALYSRMIMYYALTSTLLSIVGVSLLDFNGKHFLALLLMLLAVIWLVMAGSLVYLAARQMLETSMGEKWAVYTAVAAIGFAVISITTLQVSTNIAQILETASLIWLIGASMYLYLSMTAERSAAAISGARKVDGKVIYLDDAEHPVLYSSDRLLSGKPDFILEEDGKIVPGEFKSGRIPAGPLFSHIMQLSAYCKLVEDNYGTRPDYGYIYYGTSKHMIEFDDDIEKLMISKAAEMQSCIQAGGAHRNHRRPGKCMNCSRRDICPEKLV